MNSDINHITLSGSVEKVSFDNFKYSFYLTVCEEGNFKNTLKEYKVRILCQIQTTAAKEKFQQRPFQNCKICLSGKLRGFPSKQSGDLKWIYFVQAHNWKILSQDC